MKKTILSLIGIFSFGLSLFLFSCSGGSDKKDGGGSTLNLDSVKAFIVASNKEYGASFASNDSVKFTSSYTDDACLNPPNMPRMCGKQAIMGFFAGGVKAGIKNLKLTVDEVIGGDAAVAEIGKYEVLGDKDVSFDKGKYIVIWKQVDGKWKMHRDEWNSDNPCPPPPPAEKK